LAGLARIGGPGQEAQRNGGGMDLASIMGRAGIRGALTPDRPMADLSWLRAGGAADWLFQPADADDLAAFLSALPSGVPVLPMGVGSNLIIRDGGLPGVVIRLGRAFNAIGIDGRRVRAGAAALDAHVARKSAEAGIDLAFLRTIPGSIGGAVRMNAGCYGAYVADVFVGATAITRGGARVALSPADMAFAYRQTGLPDGMVIIEAVLEGPPGDPAALEAKMADQIARRDASQPVRERSCGSTFRNPAGYSSTGRADDRHDLKAWTLIDAAGMRGARLGGAQMSEKHPNFLINTGGATATELEGLGEEVRKRVLETSGILLQWEILRVGRSPGEPVAAPGAVQR
jgi:UDP-N-acetylmuramate dehydrogenase